MCQLKPFKLILLCYLTFGNNTIFFMLLFLNNRVILFNCSIYCSIFLNPIAKLIIPKGIPTKEAEAEIKVKWNKKMKYISNCRS